LETIREYALERLRASPNDADVRRRHADYYLALAERAAAQLHGAEQLAWFSCLEAEHDNLRAALAWSQEPGSVADHGLRLASALGGFWLVRGHLTEGRRWLESGLALADRPSPLVQAWALAEAGRLVYRQGDLGRSRELLETAAEQFRTLGNQRGLAFALTILSRVTTNRGEYPASRAQAEEALAVARSSGDQHTVADALYSLGGNQLHLSENEAARISFEAALSIDRALGDRQHASLVLSYAALAMLRQGDLVTARACEEEALTTKRAIGDSRGAATSLTYLADIALAAHNELEARPRLHESLAILRRMGDDWSLVEALDRCAALEAAEGQMLRAARLFAAVDALRKGLGGTMRRAERAGHERTVAAVRAALGAQAFAAIWAHRGSMTLGQAVAYACSSEDAGPPVAVPSTGSSSRRQAPSERRGPHLTPRERQVAALVARGLTDPQIGVALAIGTRTVETHVANCRGKLALATRTQLATWVVEHGVTTTASD
jgi:ATP/maltotriose-dependent transcriptional regulator MalT